MIRTSTLLSLATLPFFCLASVAQSYAPKNVIFKGETGYTPAELLAAAGIKKGAPLTVADMNAHTKQLMDTGLFQDVSFTFNGQDLVYQIVPATVLVPIEFENLPLVNGPELDARLRARFPLYRGKVPVDGSFVDDVRKELEAALHDEGIDAHLTAAPFTDPKLVAITAETFTISSPDVSIGAIQLDGASSELAPLAAKAAARVTGAAYSNQGSLNQIETALNNFYGERGYLGASFHIAQGARPVVDAAGIHVPFTVAVTEGSLYKLTAVTLAPDLVVTQQTFDKQSGLHPGEVVSLVALRGGWEYLAHQYHNQGCLHAQIHAEPAFDRTAGTVSYTVTATPGPVFTMGALRVVNVPAELHDPLLAAWKIPAGGVFNESMVRNLAASPNLPPELKRVLSIADVHSTLKLHEDIHTVDVELTLVHKPL
jgi:outer membrane protein insertion porin family